MHARQAAWLPRVRQCCAARLHACRSRRARGPACTEPAGIGPKHNRLAEEVLPPARQVPLLRAGEDRALAELADCARAARGPGDASAPPGGAPARLRLDFGWDLAPGGERAGGGGGAGDPPAPNSTSSSTTPRRAAAGRSPRCYQTDTD